MAFNAEIEKRIRGAVIRRAICRAVQTHCRMREAGAVKE
jgi:hypothetical protein